MLNCQLKNYPFLNTLIINKLQVASRKIGKSLTENSNYGTEFSNSKHFVNQLITNSLLTILVKCPYFG